MAAVVVFDVNETLLDLTALDPEFERIFGDPDARREWFLTFEEIWLVSIIVDSYVDFGRLARAALIMIGEQRGIEIRPEDEEKIVGKMKQLPAHPDVEEGLQLLRDGGFRLFALTNGTLSSARAQLSSANLDGYFEEILSADEVKRLKPAREPYLMAAERSGVKPADLRMVAAHAWDIAGARAAGLATAFIARPGKVLNPEGAPPDLQGPDLLTLARRILEVDRPA